MADYPCPACAENRPHNMSRCYDLGRDEHIERLRDALASCVECLDSIDGADPDDNLGSFKVDIPDGKYPRQYLINAVSEIVAKAREALGEGE